MIQLMPPKRSNVPSSIIFQVPGTDDTFTDCLSNCPMYIQGYPGRDFYSKEGQLVKYFKDKVIGQKLNGAEIWGWNVKTTDSPQ